MAAFQQVLAIISSGFQIPMTALLKQPLPSRATVAALVLHVMLLSHNICSCHYSEVR